MLALSALVVGCSGGGLSSGGGTAGGGGGCPTGNLTCPCLTNGKCNGTLTCISTVCVDLGGGGAGAGGGNAGGGTATGGTGGKACYGDTVAALPTQGACCGQTTCASEPPTGTSRCLANGDRCVCERGIWYCTNGCPASQPTPNTSCSRGTACTYSNGNVGCACINLLWMCLGVSSCPTTMPTTGNACNDLTGISCDYPNSNPALHFACVCSATGDAGSASTWTCVQSASCPSAQPAYGTSCPATAICTYATAPNHCACVPGGAAWVCL
jgi:hypothetical protein